MSIILRARLGGVFALSYKTVKHKALASLQHIASDLDMTREDRKHLAFRPASLRLKVPQSCPFLLASVAACVPLSPFILISNTRARLHHAFWLRSPNDCGDTSPEQWRACVQPGETWEHQVQRPG